MARRGGRHAAGAFGGGMHGGLPGWEFPARPRVRGTATLEARSRTSDSLPIGMSH